LRETGEGGEREREIEREMYVCRYKYIYGGERERERGIDKCM